MEYSGAGGKLIHETNQKQKISWHFPFKPTQTHIKSKKHSFYIMHLKNVKTGCISYLGLELTVHVLKSQIRFVRQSLRTFDIPVPTP